ncbi:MAG: 23S rRNA (pseudouridine(1915)-N(3))-methyltransferase RlmH [Rhizobiales bacterium]|nr:23S rRNA (pseudouridine(1915)-N(3))-methyltransferase RlmH [Hyphomicrobiales bacterium]
MRMTILAIGRMKAGPEKDLCDDYLDRARAMGRACGITALDVRDFPESGLHDASRRREAEAKALASALGPRSFQIVLDETGRALVSAEFASLLRREIEGGAGDIAFLIGGPDGHARSTRESSDLTLSLGPMTWPHRLVRVMLAEQIYRAVTIMVNHPYHRP